MGLTLFNIILERENKIADNFSSLFESVITDYCIFESSNNRAYHVNALEKYITAMFETDLPIDLYDSIIDFIAESSNIDLNVFLEMLGIYMNRSVDPRYADQAASRDKNYKAQQHKKDMGSVTTHGNIPYNRFNMDTGMYLNRSVDPKYAAQGRTNSKNPANVIALKKSLTPSAINGLKKQVATGVAKYKAA